MIPTGPHVPVPTTTDPILAYVVSGERGLVLVQQPYQSWPSSASPPASEPPPPNLLPAPGRAAAPIDDRGVAPIGVGLEFEPAVDVVLNAFVALVII